MIAAPDPRDDVYGLACVAYELLSGSHPFDGRSPLEAWKAGLSPAHSAIDASQLDALLCGLALRREERMVSVAAFLAKLGVRGHEHSTRCARRRGVPRLRTRRSWATRPPMTRHPTAERAFRNGSSINGPRRGRPIRRGASIRPIFTGTHIS